MHTTVLVLFWNETKALRRIAVSKMDIKCASQFQKLSTFDEFNHSRWPSALSALLDGCGPLSIINHFITIIDKLLSNQIPANTLINNRVMHFVCLLLVFDVVIQFPTVLNANHDGTQ